MRTFTATLVRLRSHRIARPRPPFRASDGKDGTRNGRHDSEYLHARRPGSHRPPASRAPITRMQLLLGPRTCSSEKCVGDASRSRGSCRKRTAAGEGDVPSQACCPLGDFAPATTGSVPRAASSDAACHDSFCFPGYDRNDAIRAWVASGRLVYDLSDFRAIVELKDFRRSRRPAMRSLRELVADVAVCVRGWVGALVHSPRAHQVRYSQMSVNQLRQ